LQKTLFFLSKVYKNYIANSILVIFFFLNVNKKKKKILVFYFKNRYWPRDNQIDFLFSGHFPIRLVIIKQAGYIKKKKRFFVDYLSRKQKGVLIKPNIKLERTIK